MHTDGVVHDDCTWTGSVIDPWDRSMSLASSLSSPAMNSNIRYPPTNPIGRLLHRADCGFGRPEAHSWPTSPGASRSRWFLACNGRLLAPTVRVSLSSWARLTATGSASTNQLTPSLHGGVVNDPM